MYCDKCGKYASDDLRFCPNCGNELVVEVYQDETVGDDSAINQNPKRRSRVPAVVALLIMILVFVATFIVCVANGVLSLPHLPWETESSHMHQIGEASQADVDDSGTGAETSSNRDAVTASFLGGGAKDGSVEPMVCEPGTTIKLPECGFTREGYAFDCWEDENGHQYAPGDSVTVLADMKFWAVWQAGGASSTVGSSNPSAQFHTIWNGTFEGYSQYAKGGSISRKVRFTFSRVEDSGRLSGICYIGVDDPGAGAGTGSYFVEGTINWDTGAISLHGTTWDKQEDLKYMRTYEGTVSADFRSISGTCYIDNGDHPGAWTMTAY